MAPRAGGWDIDAMTSASTYNSHEFCVSMGGAVKEIVNLLLPANLLLQKMSDEGVPLEHGRQACVDRAELDSALHLVNHAQLIAAQIRDVLATAQIQQQPQQQAAAPRPETRPREESRPRDDSRLREETRLRDENRLREDSRLRDELARRDPGDTVRAIRTA